MTVRVIYATGEERLFTNVRTCRREDGFLVMEMESSERMRVPLSTIHSVYPKT